MKLQTKNFKEINLEENNYLEKNINSILALDEAISKNRKVLYYFNSEHQYWDIIEIKKEDKIYVVPARVLYMSINGHDSFNRFEILDLLEGADVVELSTKDRINYINEEKLTKEEFKNLTICENSQTSELIQYPHLVEGKRPILLFITIDGEKQEIKLNNIVDNYGEIEIPKNIKYFPNLNFVAYGANESGETYEKYDLKVNGRFEELKSINNLVVEILWQEQNSQSLDRYILV